MISISSKVKFPPVSIKLHWPSWYCVWCLCEEVICVSTEMYMCKSCKHVDCGRTEYIEGTAHIA